MCLMLLSCQLRMDSPFSRCSESSRSDVGIRDFGFLTQRCPDGLSGHTLRMLSQILGIYSNP